MQYYGHLVTNNLNYSPPTVLLRGIKLEGIPHFGSGDCCRFFLVATFAIIITLNLIGRMKKKIISILKNVRFFGKGRQSLHI